MASLLIHAGYPKTGTTWLQRKVFDNAEVGFCIPFVKGKDARHLLINPHALRFDAESVRGKLSKRLDSAERQDLVPILTTAAFVGRPTTGGGNSKELADRLTAVFPDARVLLVVREQREMILSVWNQYVKKGGAASLERFLHPPNRTKTNVALFDLGYFEYHWLVDHYMRLFGRDSVLVLPHELLATSPPEFVSRIVEFADARPASGAVEGVPYEERRNVSVPGLGIELMRPFNALFRGAWGGTEPPGILLPGAAGSRMEGAAGRIANGFEAVGRLAGPLNRAVDRRHRRRIEGAVAGRYGESNARLADLTGLDLEPFGYEVAGPPAGAPAAETPAAA